MSSAHHASFLESVAGSPAELAKLVSLGADTPEALLAQIESSRDAFNNFVGAKRARLIVRQLRAIVGPTGRLSTRHPIGRLGVPLREVPPKTSSVDDDFLSNRDRLYAEIERLKATGAHQEMVERAERQLDELFERHDRELL
jgi:hypothetical protein